MSTQTVSLTGLKETLKQLDELGRQGDQIARDAATKAATLLRQTYLVQAISSGTGIKSKTIMRYSYIKKATAKYENARINFSGSGIPVTEYKYRLKRITDTRAKIMLEWLGGEKLAAGFINPKGKKRAPLSTVNRKTKGSKTYTYRQGKMENALGPSLATIFLDMPQGMIKNEAQTLLSRELTTLLDELLGE